LQDPRESWLKGKSLSLKEEGVKAEVLRKMRDGKQEEGAYWAPSREHAQFCLNCLGLTAPAVAVVVIAIMPVAAVSRTDREVGAATTINPDAAIIVAPSLAEDARRFTALANQANASKGVDLAAVKIEVVGSAVESARAAIAASIVFTGTDGKVSAATAVNPDVRSDDAPRSAIYARGIAPLADQFDAAVSVDRAEVAIVVV